MSSRESDDHRNTPPTQWLLRGGVLVGVLYLATGLIQGFVRDGFDFGRHALSHLANGPGGWIQTANFVVCGLMVIGAAVGIARVLRSRAGATGFVTLAAACLGVARAMSRRKEPAMAQLSFVCGLVVLVEFFAPVALAGGPAGIAGIWLAVVVGWAWLAVTSTHLARQADPR